LALSTKNQGITLHQTASSNLTCSTNFNKL